MRLDARALGLLAADIVASQQDGAVLAAFERSFYLEIGDRLLAVVSGDLQDGPINICLLKTGPITALGIMPGQVFSMTADGLARKDGLNIALSGAAIWAPESVALPIDRRVLENGLDRLCNQLDAKQRQTDSLLQFFHGEGAEGTAEGTAVLRAASPSLQVLDHRLPAWFSGSPLDDDIKNIESLLGLGPGLTPSGDDLLCGVLIACSELGELRVARQLGQGLLSAAKDRTHLISQAHLGAAIEGYGAAPLHSLLKAVIMDEGEEMSEALDAILKIGHSSGGDALGGIILTLRAYLAHTSR